jgi:hypothetical protein
LLEGGALEWWLREVEENGGRGGCGEEARGDVDDDILCFEDGVDGAEEKTEEREGRIDHASTRGWDMSFSSTLYFSMRYCACVCDLLGARVVEGDMSLRMRLIQYSAFL